MISGIAFALKKALVALVLPPFSLLFLIAAGLVISSRQRRLGMTMAAIGTAALTAISLPVVATALHRLNGIYLPLDLGAGADAQAIVIIGGGVRPAAAEYGGDTLGRLTLDRVRYGARVAKSTGLPVLVSGGAVADTEAEAVLMQRSLEGEFGVTARWVEARSRDTRENARQSANILLPAGIRKVLLVAHNVDMRRAIAEFQQAGIAVVPAPTMILFNERITWRDWIPSITALQDSYWALYELLAYQASRCPVLVNAN